MIMVNPGIWNGLVYGIHPEVENILDLWNIPDAISLEVNHH